MSASAKYWMRVCSEIKNRGTRDVLMVVCDGLKGLPDAVNAVWEKTIVQTCIVHLLRNSFRYASKRDWAQIAKDLKPVYTAASESEALDRFAEFSGKWEKRYPAIIRLWENAWAEFVPFLRFDREIRTVICTTNAIVIWSPHFGVFAVAAAGVLYAFSCVVDALPRRCLRRRSGASPLVAAVFRTSGYYVNAVQLHVNAADVLVRRGVDRDSSR